MKSYDDLKAEVESIQQQMVEAQKNERSNALKEVKRLCKKFGFTAGMLKGAGVRSKRLANLGDDDIAFLHIGKNAGTQVMNVAVKLKDYGVNIHTLGHEVKLSELPNDAKYFFSVRKPESRFLSGFYSRKRKGQPRFYSEWSKHEAEAFSSFEHANDLAENLFSKGDVGKIARMAIKSIRHTGMQQVDWFQRCAFIDQQPPLTIIRQEYFASDMQRLLHLLNLDADVNSLIAKDKISAHENDYTETTPLSDVALKNLREWYIQDCYFYEMCEDFIQGKVDHL